jgi:hypothetical protein
MRPIRSPDRGKPDSVRPSLGFYLTPDPINDTEGFGADMRGIAC